MEKEHHKRVDIYLEKGAEELLPEEIYNYGGKGIWIEDYGDSRVIKCYPDNIGFFLDVLKDSGIEIKNITIEEEIPLDYPEITRRYFKTITVGGVKIVPPWAKKIPPGALIIDPGMAFGTGRHESTKIMMKLMGKIDLHDKNVIDIGCGSGILSIYAVMLGASPVVAVDNDPDAVLSAKRNAILNRIENIHFVCADLNDVSGSFDVCLANLDIGIFQKNVKKIGMVIKKDGYLVISGVLKRERRLIREIFRGFEVIFEDYKNSWMGMILKYLHSPIR